MFKKSFKCDESKEWAEAVDVECSFNKTLLPIEKASKTNIERSFFCIQVKNASRHKKLF